MLSISWSVCADSFVLQDDHDRIVMARERLGDCLKDCDLDDAVDAPLHCHPKLLKALIEAVCLILAAG